MIKIQKKNTICRQNENNLFIYDNLGNILIKTSSIYSELSKSINNELIDPFDFTIENYINTNKNVVEKVQKVIQF